MNRKYNFSAGPAALPEEVRRWTRCHLEECELCRDLLEKTGEVTVDTRHAGAPCPEEFAAVIAAALQQLE